MINPNHSIFLAPPTFKTWDWHPEMLLPLSNYIWHLSQKLFLVFLQPMCSCNISILGCDSTTSLTWVVLLTAGDLQGAGWHHWERKTTNPQNHKQLQHLCHNSLLEPQPLLVLWLFPHLCCRLHWQNGATGDDSGPEFEATVDQPYTEALKGAPGRWGSLIYFLLSHFPSGIRIPVWAHSLECIAKLFELSVSVESSLVLNNPRSSLSSSPWKCHASDRRHLWSALSIVAARAHQGFAHRADVPEVGTMSSTQLSSAAHKSH